jgi:hypothetical protein
MPRRPAGWDRRHPAAPPARGDPGSVHPTLPGRSCAETEKHGFAALGPWNGAVKTQIFGLNSARLYNVNLQAQSPRLSTDKFTQLKKEYELAGRLNDLRDNLRHGFIARRTASV